MEGLTALRRAAAQGVLTELEAAEAAALARRERLAAGLGAGRLRVGVVGTFKAGKSSLINALLGAPTAAVDDLELTAACSLFVRSEGAGVLVEHEDGSTSECTRDSFLDRAATARSAPEWWSDVVAVHVPVTSEHDFDLVDTPGLGVVTPGRTRRAREALSRCDGVVWVIGADDIGGAEEGRALEELRRGGMPIIVALNKIDLLDADEREEATEWIDDAFPWAGDVATTSAVTGEGVEALAARLTALARDPERVRQKAAEAANRLLRTDLQRLRDRIIARIGPEVDRWAADLRILERKAELVEKRLVGRMRDRVFLEFLAEVERGLSAAPTGLTEAQVRERVNTELGSGAGQRFWGRFAERLPAELVEEWDTELELVGGDMDEAFAAFAREHLAGFLQQLGEARAIIEQADRDQTGRDIALVSAAAVAGAGYVAFLGPASAVVTFGAALGAVALPVAGVGAAALTVGKWVQGKRRDAQARAMVQAVIHEARERAWSQFVEPELVPRVRSVHRRLVESAARELLGNPEMLALKQLLDELDPQGRRMEARMLLPAPQ